MALAPSPAPLFRRAALDRLASPEQLDQRMVVIRPHSWLALASLAAIIAVVIGWSILGRIAVYVSGSGLLINEGGQLRVAAASGNGVLLDLAVAVDDTVEKDQLIGHVGSMDLEQQLVSARGLASEREAEVTRQQEEAAAEIATKRAGFAARRSALKSQRASAESRADALRSKLADEERLVADQVVTRSAVLQTRTSVAQAQQ